MGFTVPGGRSKSRELPPVLAERVEKSTREFESRFGAMAAIARANGWIDAYRREAIELVLAGLDHGGTNVQV